MADLAKAYVQIIPSAEGITEGLESVIGGPAESAGKSAGAKISEGISGALSKAGEIGAVALGAATAAVGGMTTALISGVNATADYGDNVDKMSQKLGISSTAYQEWDQVLQHAGTSMENMGSSFKTLSNAAQDASDDQVAAFEKLGLSMEEVSAMSTEDLFSAVITGLQGMEEGTERTAIATDLLGRGAMEMGALLNTSAEDTQAMIDRAHELGAIMSEEDVKAAAGFKDAMQDMQVSIQGVVRDLTANFLPSFTTVMNGVADLASGNTEAGIDQIVSGLSEIGTRLTEAIPAIGEGLSKFFDSMGPVIKENLPALVETFVNLAVQIFEYLIEALPDLISTLLPALVRGAVSLVTALITNLPEILQALWDAILGILEEFGILDWFSQLWADIQEIWNTVVEFFTGIWNGVVSAFETAGQAIQDAWNAVAEFFSGLWEGIASVYEGVRDWFVEKFEAAAAGIETAWSAISEFFSGVWDGIVSVFESVGQWFTDIFTAAKDGIVSAWESVSSFFESLWEDITEIFDINKVIQIGKDIVNGIWEGIQSMWASLVEWFSGLWDSLVGGVKDFLGIHSPSTVFAEIGENMGLGIGVGFDDAMQDVNADMRKTLEQTNASLDVNTSEAFGGGIAAPEYFSVTIDASSVKEFNDIVNLSREKRRLGRMVTA